MINKFVVALGGFNDKAVEANPIYFCLVHPVSRAFGEEEDSEPVEEAVVKTCDTISAYYNVTKSGLHLCDSDSDLDEYDTGGNEDWDGGMQGTVKLLNILF